VSRFTGIFTPLVSPIHPDGEPDIESLRRLVDYQVDGGVSGFWAMGTSSEFAAFDAAERAAMTATVVEAGRGLPVIVNISDASSRRAIEHARAAAAAGAHAVAATPPYYYPHSQDEVLRHYHILRDAVDLPLFVYNIPQTVRVRVELSTLTSLIDAGIVAGMKDSQNDLEYMRQVAMHVQDTRATFALFAGTRYLIDAAVLVGASGAIPSIANAFPRLCVEAFDRASAGDFNAAAACCRRLAGLENITSVVGGGSRNAAVLGLIKALLTGGSVIASPHLTAPFRTLNETEVEAAVSRARAREGAGIA
jgi:4-hydroxy-tetrahydrodipicolinate synthase